MKKNYFYTLFFLLLLFFNKNIFPAESATYSLNIPGFSIINIDSNTSLVVDFSSQQGKGYLLSPNSNISALSNAKNGYNVTVDQVPAPANSPNDFVLTESDPQSGTTNTIVFRLVKDNTTSGWVAAEPTTGIILRGQNVFSVVGDNPATQNGTLQMLINSSELFNASTGTYSCTLQLTLTDIPG